jgi:SpoVK/Ycf46/Vps4 family AAA+-type ATPase
MVEVGEADLTRRADQWRAALAATGLEVNAGQADSLAGRYRLAGSELDAVVDSSRLYARSRDGDGRVTLSDVETASRSTAGRGLFGLARRISPRYGWADIVVPDDQRRQLAEIVSAAQSRRRVLDEWGFGAKLSRGLGLSALFSGPPGTGKTMSAEIIARELGLDLYTVDLAMVVSKYIGETEQNLSRVFDAAEATHALLFFDEADALFGKRSEVKDAHDRYANIEISYLLQRIETYTGLVILATNLRRNLDEAFLRRLNMVVEFKLPGTAERERIWRAVLPSALPLADDVDWDFLAGRFAVAGGAIKGAVLHAAYQAAAHARPVGMADLVQGMRRELNKTGKVSTPGDFEPYAHLLGEG